MKPGQETPPQRDKAATRSAGRHDDPARGGATTPGTGASETCLSAEQQETLDRGLRLLARGIARAHLRSAAIPAPRAQHSSGTRAAVPHREAEAGE